MKAVNILWERGFIRSIAMSFERLVHVMRSKGTGTPEVASVVDCTEWAVKLYNEWREVGSISVWNNNETQPEFTPLHNIFRGTTPLDWLKRMVRSHECLSQS